MANVRSTLTTTAGDGGPDETFIGAGIFIVGRIEGQEDLRVRGRVEGSVRLSETLYVEADGIVQADVEARDVVVAGVLVGNVTATESVTLSAGARLVGNIRAPRLIIADGAGFRGEVEMGDDAGKGAVATSAASRVPAPARTTSSAARRPGAPAGSSARAPAPRAPARGGESPGRIVAQRPDPTARSEARAEPAPRPAGDEDEATLIIRHAALPKAEAPTASASKAASSAPSGQGRGRIPRGKHRARR